MRLCIYEDRAVKRLEPLTLTRPAFDLWCGVAPLWRRQQRAFGAHEVGVLVRPQLAELCQLEHPKLRVNDGDWLNDGPTILVNARWLPGARSERPVTAPHIAIVDQQVAYVVPAGIPATSADSLDSWIEGLRHTLPQYPVAGAMLDYPWDLVENNPETLCEDAAWFAERAGVRPASLHVLGPADHVLVHAEAKVEPLVVADARNGPVMIDRGAVVQSFSRLEGPCYLGEESWILGSKLRGGTIGPCCRVGGEVEASIFQGYSNKYHDGFLGHSYLGEWVNLGAGTQVSDLRNDYGQIRVLIDGQRIGTGLTKVGVFLGDHTKTGLGTLLNSGTMVGTFANLLPSGCYLPPAVPSFCTARYGQLQERTDLRQAFQTAATVMRRRGRDLTGTHIDFLFDLYDTTADARRRLIRDSELRRLRRSV
jgi:UDP-N-acetylglucosamine diphosphorylase/glucosamine-1-phosphate N-acetyltransferase